MSDYVELVAPNVDVVVDAFNLGYELGFNVALERSDELGLMEARYIVTAVYADMVSDGVTLESPVVHDVFEYVLKVLSGDQGYRDYRNWKVEGI